ncbi:MAG: hypothetical protein H3C59_01630 [Burkholderiaceae bacterium]|nr:hypothetical protein [Burkholderiaceae bacterium]
MLDLFQALGDGLVLLDRNGEVAFANRAVRERLALVDEAGGLVSEHARTLARWLNEGLLENGAGKLLDDAAGPNGEPISASVHRFGRTGFVALMLRAESARETWEAAAAAWAANLSRQLGNSLGPLLTLLESHPARSLAGFGRGQAFAWAIRHEMQQARDALGRLCSEIGRRLRETLPEAEPPRAGPVPLGTLMAGVLERLGPIARRREVRVEASFSAVESHAVGGDPFWLAWALDGLTERLIDDLPGGSSLELSGCAQVNPVLILRVYAPAGAAELPSLSAERDLGPATSVIGHYGGALGLRCWGDRRLVVLRFAGAARAAEGRRSGTPCSGVASGRTMRPGGSSGVRIARLFAPRMSNPSPRKSI